MNQEQVLRILKSGKNVFLTGKAGTGKTYVLVEYIKECEKEKKNVLCMAPTGIASLNLSSGNYIGKTMHSGFAIPIPAYGKLYEDINLSAIPKETKLADVIIIDEISMCRNDNFEYFAFVIQKIKKELGRNIQIIVCGDFFQLPPVVKEEDKRKLKQFGLDPSGYCFLSPEWNKFKFKFCELTEIKRQNDTEFIENLGKLREGDASCIPYFNQHVNKDIVTCAEDIVICSLNSKANEINEKFLSEIPGPRYAYGCERVGKTSKEYSVDDTIFLKPGARVIFMVNDVIDQKYQNGTIGIVVECKDKSVIVKIKNEEVEVSPYEWKSHNITISNGEIYKKEVGKFKQLPIKLAYAITMHKTQGQTYEKCIISPDSFTDGQLYVAISRAKSIDGLILTEPILPEYIKTSPLVKEFYLTHKIDVPEWIIEKKKTVIEKRKNNKSKTKSKSKPKAKNSTSKKTTSKKTNSKSSFKNTLKNRKTQCKSVKRTKTVKRNTSAGNNRKASETK